MAPSYMRLLLQVKSVKARVATQRVVVQQPCLHH